MFSSHRQRGVKSSDTPDLNDEEGNSLIEDADDVDVAVDVDVDAVPTQKPHFLDDATPPPEMIEDFDRILTFGKATESYRKTAALSEETVNTSCTGEQLKMDKKYERDGEISDYELAASGYTKKEFTQDDNTLNMPSKSTFSKPKHFLDENPIPPDYMLLSTAVEHDTRREHRSLDRNFERHGEQVHVDCMQSSQTGQGMKNSITRKSSLDRGGYGGSGGASHSGSVSSVRSSRERNKDLTSSYTMSRFFDSEAPAASLPPLQRVPKGAAWTGNFDRYYCSLPMSHVDANVEVDEPIDVDRLGPKVECVYSLLSMLGSNDPAEMSKKFLELSRSPDTCTALRGAGCVPLLVQMMHSDGEETVRKFFGMALQNVVHSHPDEKTARREAKVLRLLEQILDYCNFLKSLLQSGGEAIADDSERHPLAAISSLMKVSFDEEHRHAMCELGALQAIPNLVHLDHAVHGPKPEDQCCNSLRRYALMALTNLTFGDEHNKAYLCSQKLFMEALVAQLDSAPDDLLQVTASVLRNLSWRADSNMKAVLNEIGTVTVLAHAAMKNKSENTLKAILSALWNLSAHCSTNKAEFCAVDGALAFLVDMLTYEGPSKTLKIIENAGGILRNVSSHIAKREHYRQILRERNCLSILLQQLKSESLTVVSNSCGTLWNLSARCPEDQKFLWDNGAVPMLRSLIHSKHSMISEGSASALKNLLNFRPAVQSQSQLDPIARSMGLRQLPTLNARKQKALEQELGEKQHAETCDNLDMSSSRLVKEDQGQKQHLMFSGVMHTQKQRNPLAVAKVPPAAALRLTRSAMLTKSESRDSVFSAKSDTTYENLMRSHSASDANRKALTQKIPFAAAAAAFSLDNDVESTEVEQPIDYSAKYSENVGKSVDETNSVRVNEDVNNGAPASGGDSISNYATYQETDLDQPTDFSLLYAERQVESDADILPPEAAITGTPTSITAGVIQEDTPQVAQAVGGGNEILLILEDTVKCYQTEDTPYVISNAASVTDLRQATNKGDNITAESTVKLAEKTKKYQKTIHAGTVGNSANIFASGSYTPEKPINYCEEGTPGYFSRYESLSSLDEPALTAQVSGSEKLNNKKSLKQSISQQGQSTHLTSATPATPAEPIVQHVDNTSNMNSAQETPLMFSRHSSMDSLVGDGDEEIVVCDDKSSVVSDFSRLASGVISPSEIPDSPTQSMPQSPRRNNSSGHISAGSFLPGVSPSATRSSAGLPRCSGFGDTKRPLRSVFEDDLSTFNVENTPAQFSSATSLSNLSIVDDESSLPPSRQPECDVEESVSRRPQLVSEGEEEESCNNIDDILLANCINMGMNRATATAAAMKKVVPKDISRAANDMALPADEPKHYYTEDTPALLSKVGSNTNLSAISICSSSNEPKCLLESDMVYEISANPATNVRGNENRHSLNLSDDVSSNASESGAAGQSFDLLQQCIEVGMKKPLNNKAHSKSNRNLNENENAMKPGKSMAVLDPIAMLRRGGNILPPYLPVSDEMSKYLVEDSPCNFSVASGLSNLTVGSSLVGPAVQLKGADANTNILENVQEPLRHMEHARTVKEGVRLEQQWQDDSLSSLSIDSEDDTNLLSQAIAAGCNRPKSNLGFSSATSTSSKQVSLSASQPIPINTANSASSLHSSGTARQYKRQQQSAIMNRHQNGNDSFSSLDSSDSNDNQAKSLFELCIRTGMHKSTGNSRRQHMLGSRKGASGAPGGTQSNPNLKQFEHLPSNAPQSKAAIVATLSTGTAVNRHLRDRERKDERLLLECINTGISKKIGNTSYSSASSKRGERIQPVTIPLHGDNIVNTSTGPKNVLATSAAALEPCHQHAATTSSSATSTAAPDVKTNSEVNTNRHNISSATITHSSENNYSFMRHNLTCGVITREAENLEIITVPAANRPNHGSDCEPKMNGIGSKDELCQDECYEEQESVAELSSQSISLDNTASDDSNESFIIETTVSLEAGLQNMPTVITSEKHKDPDLMLKSVERLTLEFVSSAEQLRINGANNLENSEHSRALGSISLGVVSNSNNTWNEDTCPNDVSFPSVSVTAPVVASLKYDDDDEDDDAALATEADHKDLHDFAEITPTNEEQPQPSLLGLESNELLSGVNNSQPSSLDTEADTYTLVYDNCTALALDTQLNFESSTDANNSGINFKLGGAVKSAAATMNAHRMLYGSTADASMTNSTIIAIEARTLAETLQQHDSNDDLTFSIGSLDLDNIRPPSGMESLNISGYYHEQSPGGNHSQPHSFHRVDSFNPQSPQFSTKSPKFPRKTLPHGLVAKRALGHLPNHLSGSAESVNSSCNMLENIKPPSLMDELLDSMISVASIQSEVADCESSMATTVSAASNYETAAGGNGADFDDNTITLQSCYETMPHDGAEWDLDADEGSLNDSTPLPTDDYEYTSAESTPQKSVCATQPGEKRKLTPKQKRKAAKDRYKTYTIASDVKLSDEELRRLEIVEAEIQQEETLQIEITETVGNTPSPISRRRADAGRYKTQTIIYGPTTSLQNEVKHFNQNTACADDLVGPYSLTSTEECLSDDASSIRAMTQKFKFITMPNVRVATTVQQVSTHEDGYTSIECDQNSETESCHGQDAAYEDDMAADESDDDQNGGQSANGGQPLGKSRVTKSITTFAQSRCSDIAEEGGEEQAKTIRGRKKAAYVSPYSMHYQRNVSPKTRIASNKVLTSTASSTNNFRKRDTNAGVAHVSEARVAQKRNTATTANSKATINNNENATPQTPSGVLQRQGTFVQDEPTVSTSQVPVVVSEVTSSLPPTPGGSPQRSSKLPTKRGTGSLKATPSLTQAAATRKLPITAKPPIKAHQRKNSPATTTTAASTLTKRSNSNAAIRVTSNAARIAVLSARVSATTPPSRSNSNLNCNTAAASATKSAAAKISQAQSRIASIWKRVDDAKSKQTSTVNNRAVASNLKTIQQTKSSPTLNAQKTQQQQRQQKQATPLRKESLTRSSTFDNTPNGNSVDTTSVKSMNSARTTVMSCATGSAVVGQRKIRK